MNDIELSLDQPPLSITSWTRDEMSGVLCLDPEFPSRNQLGINQSVEAVVLALSEISSSALENVGESSIASAKMSTPVELNSKLSSAVN